MSCQKNNCLLYQNDPAVSDPAVKSEIHNFAISAFGDVQVTQGPHTYWADTILTKPHVLIFSVQQIFFIKVDTSTAQNMFQF